MMKITGLSHLFKWENLHNWWLTKYFFAPLYITSPNDFSYFKRSSNSSTTKTNKTLAKYIHIVSNVIKKWQILSLFCYNYVLVCM